MAFTEPAELEVVVEVWEERVAEVEEERDVGGKGTRRSLSISLAKSGVSVREAAAMRMSLFFN
jgi:hypothetical protein